MASPGGNMFHLDLDFRTTFTGFSAVALSGLLVSRLLSKRRTKSNEGPGLLRSFLLFFYSCFIKPHNGDKKGTQQDALESFYKTQAGAYDATRKILLQGREDMLALIAAQLKAKANGHKKGRIWVDVSGLTSGDSVLDHLLICLSTTYTIYRLVVERDGISKPCLPSSMSPSFSPVFISLISPHPFAKLLDDASGALVGRTSRLFVKMRANFGSRIMKMVFLAVMFPSTPISVLLLKITRSMAVWILSLCLTACP
jgi:hypothetical protein